MVNQISRWFAAHPARAGTLMGWYQQGASVGVAIILIPQVIGLLSTEETAVWFLCQSLLGIVALAKFGVAFTIARQIAYSKAASGDSVDAWEGDFVVFRKGWDGISEIFVLARIIFHFVSLVGISICLIVGEVILPMGRTTLGDLHVLKLTWYILGFSAMFVLYSYRYSCFLEGLGLLYFNHLLNGTYLLITGISVLIALRLTHSLVVMATCQLVCSMVMLGAFQFCLGKAAGSRLAKNVSPDWSTLRELLAITVRIGLIHSGSFLFRSAQVPVIGFVLGTAAVTPFYIAQKIATILKDAIGHILYPQIPFFTSECAAEDWQSALKRFKRAILYVSCSALVAQSAFFFLSPLIVDIWVGPDSYIGRLPLLGLAFDLFISTNVSMLLTLTLAGGKNPFVWSISVGGVLNLVFCLFLAERYGIGGIVASGLAAGLLYYLLA